MALLGLLRPAPAPAAGLGAEAPGQGLEVGRGVALVVRQAAQAEAGDRGRHGGVEAVLEGLRLPEGPRQRQRGQPALPLALVAMGAGRTALAEGAVVVDERRVAQLGRQRGRVALVRPQAAAHQARGAGLQIGAEQVRGLGRVQGQAATTGVVAARGQGLGVEQGGAQGVAQQGENGLGREGIAIVFL